jgi:hypothetical protein
MEIIVLKLKKYIYEDDGSIIRMMSDSRPVNGSSNYL